MTPADIWDTVLKDAPVLMAGVAMYNTFIRKGANNDSKIISLAKSNDDHEKRISDLEGDRTKDGGRITVHAGLLETMQTANLEERRERKEFRREINDKMDKVTGEVQFIRGQFAERGTK